MSTDIRQRPEGALFRTYLSAAGVGPDAIQKPLIGVATAATQVFSEKPDAKELGNATATNIAAAPAANIARRLKMTDSPASRVVHVPCAALTHG